MTSQKKLKQLIRARMEALPLPNRPAAPHGDDDAGLVRHAAMRTLAQLKRAVELEQVQPDAARRRAART